MGEEVSFQPLFKNIGEKLVFQIGGFSATFSSKFKNSTSGWLLICTCTVHYSQKEMKRVTVNSMFSYLRGGVFGRSLVLLGTVRGVVYYVHSVNNTSAVHIN